MLMAIWSRGNWETPALIAGVVFGTYLLVMWLGALVWTYRDIRARTRDPFTHAIALLVVLAFGLPGILLYMVLRPKETLAEQYDRRLGSEALLHEIQEQETCPTCRRKIEEDFLACPYCRTGLRAPCDACRKALHTSWVLCPFCGADRAPLTRPEPVPLPTESRGHVSPPPTPARRASTATYTPPAPKPAPSSSAEAPD